MRGWALLLLLAPSPAWAAGASRYNEAPPTATATRAPLIDKIDALVLKLARDERRTEPLPDARLDAAAADIARVTPDRGGPPNELVQGALWLHGIIEPPPHLMVAAMDAGSAGEELLRSLAADLPNVLAEGRYSRVGVALVPEAGRDTRVLIALQESFIDLEPMPRSLPNGGSTALRGQLHAGFERPEALVTAPSGVVTRLPLDGDAHRFHGTFACGPQKGRYQIELVGEDRFGATVLANFPVWCGQSAPSTAAAAAPTGGTREEPFTTTAQAELTAWKLLNDDRKRAGLPPLEQDAKLAAVARGHSADMQAHGFFGHVSPTTGTAGDRVRKAKIDALLILENVARASTPGEAERGLMNSPGHRANILNKEATHVGIGIVATDDGGQRELLVTQLFSHPPEAFGPHTVDDLRKKMREARVQKHLAPLERDNNLDHLAQLAADDMVRSGLTADEAGRHIDFGLDGDHWLSARSVVAVVASPTQVVDALRSALGDGNATHYGLGVAPGKRKDGGNGLYVILVLAARR